MKPIYSDNVKVLGVVVGVVRDTLGIKDEGEC